MTIPPLEWSFTKSVKSLNMNSVASKISVMKFQIKWMRQFLDLYGFQQCTNYYRSKYLCYKFLWSLCFLKLFKLQSEFILHSNNVSDKLLYAVRDTASFESNVYVWKTITCKITSLSVLWKCIVIGWECLLPCDSIWHGSHCRKS